MAKFTKLSKEDRNSGSIEALIRNCEQACDVHITIHDHLGFFKTADGQALLAERNIHWHPYCQLGRAQSFQHCSDHCKDAVPAEARNGQAFVTRCWKGLRELILPLFVEDRHIATVFVGGWRSQKMPRLPQDVRHQQNISVAHKQLRAFDQERIEILKTHLMPWLDGLVRQVEALQGLQQHTHNRADIIRAFIYRHAHQRIFLADLASELGCSTSRAGHICQEAYGQGFQALVLHERLQRACVLLTASPASIAEIAESCGFGDVYYFSRIFKQRIGESPGRYRKHHSPSGTR